MRQNKSEQPPAYEFVNPSDQVICSYLKNSHVIAVVGLSDYRESASFQVSSFLKEVGYQVIPINPRLAGQKVLGERVYSCLQELPFPVDIVNVYRKSEYLPEIARDFLAINAKIFWAQLHLQNQQAENLLRSAGKHHLIMNRCIKREYQRLIKKERLV